MTTTDAAKNLLSYGFHLISLLPKSKNLPAPPAGRSVSSAKQATPTS
jgi:hypothetical protein